MQRTNVENPDFLAMSWEYQTFCCSLPARGDSLCGDWMLVCCSVHGKQLANGTSANILQSLDSGHAVRREVKKISKNLFSLWRPHPFSRAHIYILHSFRGMNIVLCGNQRKLSWVVAVVVLTYLQKLWSVNKRTIYAGNCLIGNWKWRSRRLILTFKWRNVSSENLDE